MTAASPITTHVLDTSTGRPAAEVAVVLTRRDKNGQWEKLAEGATDADGRLADLLAPGSLAAGVYRLTFATGEYFRRQTVPTFYPSVTVEFHVTAGVEHYHVPLLLSPFGYTTYRGS